MPRFIIPSGVKIFILIWIGVFLTPPLREIFQASAIVSGGSIYTSRDMPALKRRYPNDVRVLAMEIPGRYWSLPNPPPPKVQLANQLADYDALIKRFPKEHWLRAERLFLVLSRHIDMDYEGAPKRGSKLYVDKTQLEESVVVAREGEKLDAGNAFFPWMEAIFLFGLGKNDQGATALQKAANDSRFDDYVKERTRQRLQLATSIHKVLFEEKLGMETGVLLPHFSKMRDAQKTAVKVALDAHKKGDDKRALEIINGILEASAVFRDHSDNILGLLIGESFIRGTLKDIDEANGVKVASRDPGTLSARQEQSVALARDFGTYARRHGRSDIARRALQIAQVPLPNNGRWNSGWWEEFGLDDPWGRTAFQGVWFTAHTGYGAFLFAAFWILSVVFFSLLKRKDPESVSEGLIGRGQVAVSTNFSIWAMLGYAALAAYFGVGFPFGTVGWVQSLDLSTNEMINGWLTNSAVYIALATWIFPILFFLWRRDYTYTPRLRVDIPSPSPVPHQIEILRRGLWIFTLLVAIITLTNGRNIWEGTLLDWLASPLLAWSSGLISIGIELYRAVKFKKVAFGRLRLGQIRRQLQPYRWYFATRLLGSTAGVLSIALSLVFLCLALGMWPLRATQNRAIERRIAIGEVKWSAEQEARRAKNGAVSSQ